MSYSLDVKEDILKLNMDASLHLVELEAFLRLGGEVVISNPMKLIFSSPNMHILRYFITIIKKNYTTMTYKIEAIEQQKLKRQTSYVCTIYEMSKNIISDLALLEAITPLKDMILENESLMKAYLRGAFLAKGSVNDPKTSNYHLEINTDYELEAQFLQRAINTFDLNARIIKRRNHLVIYMKEKEKIVDFLRYVGANVSMNEFENVIIKRDISANVNRLLNIEVANQQKTNQSAKEQLKYIHYLEKNYPLDKLDPKLMMVIDLRKNNPEASLMELLKILNEQMNENITKSGLNHRFRRIKEIALDIAERKRL